MNLSLTGEGNPSMRYSVVILLTLTGIPALAQPAPHGKIDPDPSSATYKQGSADRDSWENWFNGLVGSKRDGANFWTSQRSLKAPIQCRTSGYQSDPAWLSGCLEAQQRLNSSDYLRYTDAQYWNGWNKVAVTPVVPYVQQSDLPPPNGTLPCQNGPCIVPTQRSFRPSEPIAHTDRTSLPVVPSSVGSNQWSGITDMTTRPFHVDGSWEIQWTAGSGYFSIYLVNAVNDKTNLIANQDKAGSSSSYIPKGGDFYLKVSASEPWSIKIVKVAVPAVTPTEPATPTPAEPSTPVSTDDRFQCDDKELRNHAIDLIQESTNPLFGQIKILSSYNFRRNVIDDAESFLSDKTSQCVADVVTNRGEMRLYYGWKTINDQLYITTHVFPKLN